MTDIEIIRQIEKELSIKLKMVSNLFLERQGYILNQAKHVASLGLNDCKIKNLTGIISLIKQLTDLSNLDLMKNQISDISLLKELTNLTHLNLRYNQISNITPLKKLTNLTHLNLIKNQISDMSPLKDLTNLMNLNLMNNKISDMSPLKDLTNLVNLNLMNNQISDMSPLKDLTNLVNLNLTNNQISDISPLKGLTNLMNLDLMINRISDISPLKELANLTNLYLNQNQISDIFSLKGLTNLTNLDLTENKVSDISPLKDLKKITSLGLSANPIKELPPWIIELPIEIKWIENTSRDSRCISLFDNPLASPPPEIVKQGNMAIRNYFAQLKEQEEDYLFEAKMLIVGEPGAGKTSLAWKMENPDCKLPEEDETTRGIDVKQYYFPVQKEDFSAFKHPEKLENKKFRLNLWDFGGQEIYKATHRFFLSKRSLYVLVADSRNEDTDFNYWLHIVEMFGGESPLLIVLNEKHLRKRNIDISAMKKRFTNISEVLEVDFAEVDKTRLIKLERAVKYYVSQLPHIGSAIPAKWTLVRKAIENDNHNTITLQDYLMFCKDNGISRPQDALVLSQYFHDIGVFLHFQDDDLLNKTIFLNPTWATGAVYKVLDHELLNRQNGQFNKADAKVIWSGDEYEFVRDELLRLMQKFFLTYEIETSGEYIVPERLPAIQPEYVWDEKDNLFLQYEYDFFMPKGIMSQLTVQMHRYICNHELVWRRGVVLERENTTAEIIETYDARSIKIRISGKNRRDFMTIITETLDTINAQFEKMKVEKLIPCNCKKCKTDGNPYFHKYKDLKRRLENEKQEVECGNSYQMVNVRGLIDEVLNEKHNNQNMKGKVFELNDYQPKKVTRDKVFISYSHKDQEWLGRVQTHLKVLSNLGIAVNSWDDTQIKSGMKWREEIQKTLTVAKVAVLLISTDFLASEFISNNELPPLLKAAENDGATILPLILKPCLYTKHQKLAEFQAVNDPGRALSKLTENEQDEILVALAERIAELVEADN